MTKKATNDNRGLLVILHNPWLTGFLLFVTFAFLGMLTLTNPFGDLGEYLNNPVRVLDGQLPYRDFWLLFPPGEVLLPAAIYWLFGVNVNNVMLVGTLAHALIGVAAFVAARQVLKEDIYAVAVAALVFFFGTDSFYMLLLLAAVIALLRYLEKKNGSALFVSGLAAGAAAMFRLHESGAAALSFILAIILCSHHTGKRPAAIAREIGVFIAGLAVVPALMLAGYAEIWNVAIYDVTLKTILESSRIKLPYSYTTAWWYDALMTQLSAPGINVDDVLVSLAYFVCSFLLYLLLPLVAIGFAYIFLAGRTEFKDRVIAGMFLCWGILTLPKVFWRADLAHIAQEVVPLFFTLAWIVARGRTLPPENNSLTDRGLILMWTVPLLLLLAGALVIQGVSIHSYLTTPQYQVAAAHGTLTFTDSAEATNVSGLIGYIENNTREGDYIFVTPWDAPPLYALTGRKNPTYYDSMIDLIARPSDAAQERVCREIAARDTKLIVHYDYWSFESRYDLSFRSSCPIINKYIHDNYRSVKTYGRFVVYEKIAG